MEVSAAVKMVVAWAAWLVDRVSRAVRNLTSCATVVATVGALAGGLVPPPAPPIPFPCGGPCASNATAVSTATDTILVIDFFMNIPRSC